MRLKEKKKKEPKETGALFFFPGIPRCKTAGRAFFSGKRDTAESQSVRAVSHSRLLSNRYLFPFLFSQPCFLGFFILPHCNHDMNGEERRTGADILAMVARRHDFSTASFCVFFVSNVLCGHVRKRKQRHENTETPTDDILEEKKRRKWHAEKFCHDALERFPASLDKRQTPLGTKRPSFLFFFPGSFGPTLILLYRVFLSLLCATLSTHVHDLPLAVFEAQKPEVSPETDDDRKGGDAGSAVLGMGAHLWLAEADESLSLFPLFFFFFTAYVLSALSWRCICSQTWRPVPIRGATRCMKQQTTRV